MHIVFRAFGEQQRSATKGRAEGLGLLIYFVKSVYTTCDRLEQDSEEEEKGSLAVFLQTGLRLECQLLVLLLYHASFPPQFSPDLPLALTLWPGRGRSEVLSTIQTSGNLHLVRVSCV
jgi:hypothetical protein